MEKFIFKTWHGRSITAYSSKGLPLRKMLPNLKSIKR
jgi:hypothetical protein